MKSDSVTGELYQTAVGQWAFRIYRDGVEIAGGAGYADQSEAQDALTEVIATYSTEGR